MFRSGRLLYLHYLGTEVFRYAQCIPNVVVPFEGRAMEPDQIFGEANGPRGFVKHRHVRISYPKKRQLDQSKTLQICL